MKLCKNCNHFSSIEVCYNKEFSERSMVTGEYTYRYASLNRINESYCGKEARAFEERVSIWKLLFGNKK